MSAKSKKTYYLPIHSKDIDNLCHRCPHRRYCTKPCPLVEKLINMGSVYFQDQTEDSIGMCKAEIRFSALEKPNSNGEMEDYTDTGRAIDTQAHKEFWDSIKPEYRTQNCEIFADVFFKNYSYQDVAEKYDMTADQARERYTNMVRRFIRDIVWLEEHKDEKARITTVKQKMLKNHGKFNKYLIYYLAYHVFGMSQEDLAEFFDVHRGTINQAIKKYTQRAKNGEPIFVFDDEGKPVGEVSRFARQPKGPTNREKIIDALYKRKEPMTASELAKAIGKKHPKALSGKLSYMVSTGDLYRPQPGYFDIAV